MVGPPRNIPQAAVEIVAVEMVSMTLTEILPPLCAVEQHSTTKRKSRPLQGIAKELGLQSSSLRREPVKRPRAALRWQSAECKEDCTVLHEHRIFFFFFLDTVKSGSGKAVTREVSKVTAFRQ